MALQMHINLKDAVHAAGDGPTYMMQVMERGLREFDPLDSNWTLA